MIIKDGKEFPEFFKSHVLIHNKRITQKIVISDQNDSAFAVVDVDILWKNTKTQKGFLGKWCTYKIYTKEEQQRIEINIPYRCAKL